MDFRINWHGKKLAILPTIIWNSTFRVSKYWPDISMRYERSKYLVHTLRDKVARQGFKPSAFCIISSLIVSQRSKENINVIAACLNLFHFPAEKHYHTHLHGL